MAVCVGWDKASSIALKIESMTRHGGYTGAGSMVAIEVAIQGLVGRHCYIWTDGVCTKQLA